MFGRTMCLLAAVVGLCFFVHIQQSHAADPQLVINELMWMGSSVSSSDEWIELRNVTDQPVDIGNWKLTKKSSGVEKPMLTIPAGRTIPPGGIFLISHYAPGVTSALAVTPDLVTSDVSLVNSALQIKLYDANGAVVDVADDGSGNPLAGLYNSASKLMASMERNPVPGDGTLSTSWHTATRAVGWRDSATELGTPGAANSNGRPMAEAGPDVTSSVGQLVQFDGSESSDPEQSPLIWHWDLGDGTFVDGATPTHTYASSGTFPVTLTVSDGIDTATDLLQVTILPATDATPTEDNTAAPVSAPATSCRGLELWSIVPNPVGADTTEEIVVKNVQTTTIEANSCAVFVGTAKWKISGVDAVAAGVVVTLPQSQTHLRLPNGGGTVRLVDVDGTELDRTTYTIAAEGRRWERTGNSWAWSKASVQAAVKKTTKKTAAKKAPTVVHVLASVAELQTLISGDLVKVTGMVTVPVDAFGVLQTTIADSSGAAAVVLAAGGPKLTVGDVISLAGKVRTLDGRRRIAADVGSVRVLRHETVTATPAKVDDLTTDDTGRLVALTGVLTAVSGSRFEIDDGSDVISVGIKSSTGILRPRMTVGDSIVVTGVVSAGSGGLRLYPRTADDIVVRRVLGASTTAPAQTLVTSPKQQTWWYWLAAGAGLLIGNGSFLWRCWRQWRAKSTIGLDGRSEE